MKTIKKIRKDNIWEQDGSDWQCVYSPKQIALKQIYIHTCKNTEQWGTLVVFGKANGVKGMRCSFKIHAFWTLWVSIFVLHI